MPNRTDEPVETVDVTFDHIAVLDVSGAACTRGQDVTREMCHDLHMQPNEVVGRIRLVPDLVWRLDFTVYDGRHFQGHHVGDLVRCNGFRADTKKVSKLLHRVR